MRTTYTSNDNGRLGKVDTHYEVEFEYSRQPSAFGGCLIGFMAIAAIALAIAVLFVL